MRGMCAREGRACVRALHALVFTRSQWETDSKQIGGDRARSRPCFVFGAFRPKDGKRRRKVEIGKKKESVKGEK